jgi:hypothetical protein
LALFKISAFRPQTATRVPSFAQRVKAALDMSERLMVDSILW